jgi:hypothetical protein
MASEAAVISIAIYEYEYEDDGKRFDSFFN